jgi:uncharacterized protein
MPAIMKRIINKYTPSPISLKENKYLGVFGTHLYAPSLWHINRRSVSGAFAVGLFCAWVPIPFQMVLAALFAVVFSVNLPVSVALVWLTNPITIPPLFYFAYWVGEKMLNNPPKDIKFEVSLEWLWSILGEIWQPFLLGCFTLAVVSSVLGYAIVKGLWRWQVVRRMKVRRLR